jgi:hypothetical protein
VAVLLLLVLALLGGLGAALWFNPVVKAKAVSAMSTLMPKKPEGRSADLQNLKLVEERLARQEAELKELREEAGRLREENLGLRRQLAQSPTPARRQPDPSPPAQPPPAPPPPLAPILTPQTRTVRDGDAAAIVGRLLDAWGAIERISDRPMEYRRMLRDGGVVALMQRGEALERLADELITSGIVEYFAVPDSASGRYGLFVGPQILNIRESLGENEPQRAKLALFFRLSTQDRVFRLDAPALVEASSSGFRLSRFGELSI